MGVMEVSNRQRCSCWQFWECGSPWALAARPKLNQVEDTNKKKRIAASARVAHIARFASRSSAADWKPPMTPILNCIVAAVRADVDELALVYLVQKPVILPAPGFHPPTRSLSPHSYPHLASPNVAARPSQNRDTYSRQQQKQEQILSPDAGKSSIKAQYLLLPSPGQPVAGPVRAHKSSLTRRYHPSPG